DRRGGVRRASARRPLSAARPRRGARSLSTTAQAFAARTRAAGGCAEPRRGSAQRLIDPNRNPLVCGGFLSRPVSRILSRVTILLCRLPGSSAGRLIAEPVRLAPDGVRLAAVSPRRWWALTPPSHPYRRRLRRSRRRRSVFCATVRRLSPPPSRERPALRCPDFPRAPKSPRSPGLQVQF